MQGTGKATEKRSSTDEDRRTAITSEDEFERWLIAALEWERQRLQGSGAAGSRPERGQQPQ